ncbi:MAG TPA: SDR family oxidoreductase [Pseudonocardiaceae bacterium]|nr:SDR family oxidoreductase [Pseudonocardiaceae bacterium]
MTDTSAHRRVLVTGGSRGIGAAICRRLAARGDRLAIHCRTDKGAAERLRDELPNSDEHFILVADLADPNSIRPLVDVVAGDFGGIDVFVHNAGIFVHQPVATTTFDEWMASWRRVLEVNLLAAAGLAHGVIDHMLHRPEGPAGGRIVMVGSRGAYRGEPDAPAYGASKAGLHSLAQSLAVAVAPHGIGVAAVAPGFINTDLSSASLAGPAGDAIRAQSPFGRVGEPDEVAAAVEWLASPDSTWATGTIIDVNGASYLR